MQFTPKTQKELDEANLMPPGDYPAMVMTADDAVSKAGNEMIKLQLQIQTPSGPHPKSVWDHLVPNSGIEYKVRHFAYSAGIEALYEQGRYVASDCEGRGCTVTIDIEDASGGYPAKNIVKDYLEVSQPQKATPQAEPPHALPPLPAGLNGEPVDDASGLPF